MSCLLRQSVSLLPLNTFGLDARAAWFARVESADDLRQLLDDPRVRDLPRVVLGGGSNVLFAGDVDGLVIQPAPRGIEDLGLHDGAQRIRVGAGEPWADVVARLVRTGMPGLENLALIPGLTGAAPIQNIGAYGLELAERLHSVAVWEPATGAVRELTPDQCGLGYRDSAFKRESASGGAARRIVLGLTLRLPRPWTAVTGYAELERELALRACPQPGPADIFGAVCALRQRKLPDPAITANAGSFFKNPIVDRAQHAQLIERFPSIVSYPLAGGRFKLGAGWMIESCALKGMTRGSAAVYEGQALVLVNRGGARSADVLRLAREVQQRVLDRFGVRLEPEVQIIGGSGAELL